jgi:hypothetical protein
MTAPRLPANIAKRYWRSSSEESVRRHQRHHDVIHNIVNAFDDTIGAAAPGDVLQWNGTSYVPAPQARVRVNRPSNATYTLTAEDGGGTLIVFTQAETCRLIIPAESAVPFQTGTRIQLAQLGAGQVTIDCEPTVWLRGTPGLKLLDQFSGAEVIKVAADSWWVVGRLSA